MIPKQTEEWPDRPAGTDVVDFGTLMAGLAEECDRAARQIAGLQAAVGSLLIQYSGLEPEMSRTLQAVDTLQQVVAAIGGFHRVAAPFCAGIEIPSDDARTWLSLPSLASRILDDPDRASEHPSGQFDLF